MIRFECKYLVGLEQFKSLPWACMLKIFFAEMSPLK